MLKAARFLVSMTRDKFGLEIRRAPRAKRIRPAPPGRIVEFTGVSGVGKSYLMRRCLKVLGPSYLTQPEIGVAINVADYRFFANKDVQRLYQELLEDLLSKTQETSAGEVDLERLHDLQFYAGKLKNNMLIDAAYPIQAVTDEGLVKNFLDPLLRLAESGHLGARAVLRRRHIILLETDPELALSQIQERKRYDRYFEGYRGWTPEEIRRHYIEESSKYSARIEALRPWVAGVLRLSRSESTRQNVEAVEAFVQRFVAEGSDPRGEPRPASPTKPQAQKPAQDHI